MNHGSHGAAIPGTGTPLSTALNLAATSMGTGLLTLPHAAWTARDPLLAVAGVSGGGSGEVVEVLANAIVFAGCGPLVASMLLVVLSLTTDVTLVLLVSLGRVLNVSTFGSLMRRIFGKSGSFVFQLTLISVLFLALTAMQRVVMDLLPIFVESICGLIPGTVKPLMLSTLVNFFVIAACFSKNYHALRFTSGAALLCLLPFVLSLWFNAATNSDPPPRPVAESISSALSRSVGAGWMVKGCA
eukprot:Skav202994  [mRNA]  locus=scaffold2267:686768:694717:- [translate_table: standard]